MLAISSEPRSFWRMEEPTSVEKANRIVYGRALKALRERSGMTLQEAASNLRRFGDPPSGAPRGISVQRWQQAERGVTRFTEEQIGRFTEALGCSPEDLEVQRAKIMGQQPRRAASGMGEREGRAMVIPIFGRAKLDAGGWKIKDSDVSEGSFDLKDLVAPSIGLLYMADDTMVGLAEAGAAVIFDRSRRPSEGKGCVIETAAGELYPRIFVGIDDEHVLVKSMTSPKPQAFRRADVTGIYAVKFWGG